MDGKGTLGKSIGNGREGAAEGEMKFSFCGDEKDLRYDFSETAA